MGRTRASKIYFNDKILIKNRNESTDDLLKRINNEIRKFNIYNASSCLYELASHPKLPIGYLPVYGSGREYYDIYKFSEIISSQNYIFWLMGIFKSQENLLSYFVSTRKKINRLILTNKPDDALNLLKELNERCKTWWSIHLEINITKEILKKDTRVIIENLGESFPLANISSAINNLKLISESSSINVFVRDLLNRMKEYRSSGISNAINYGAIDSCRFIPLHMDPERRPKLSVLKEDSYDSIIDQYVIFKEVCSELCFDDSIPSIIKEKVIDLGKAIADDELLSLFDIDTQPVSDVEEIISLYTHGEYNKVIEKINSSLSGNEYSFLGLFEIYAKSLIYSKNEVSNNYYFTIISQSLASILQCEKKTIEILNFLDRIVVKFKSESWAKSLNFHIISALESIQSPEVIQLARLQTKMIGNFNTPKAKLDNYKLTKNDIGINNIPEYRLIKYNINEIRISEINENTFPIKSDYLKIRSKYLLGKNEILEAMSFCINEYIYNNVSFIHLPIPEICQIATNIEKKDNDTFISSLVLYDIFSREHNNQFEDIKNETFEDLMLYNKSHRPSLVFNKKTHNNIEKYFLKNICIPTQLDNFTEFDTDDDVILERIAILDMLINEDPEDSDKIKVEKDSVLENLFSEKLRAKIEAGKLYVDVQSLISKRKHIYQGLFEQVKSFKDSLLIAHLSSEDNFNSEDLYQINDSNVVPSSKKMELLSTIYYAVVNDFTLNENYGLDKYLSAEIRHIVFTTQLRSCFEKTNLVTSKKNGDYLKNNYWIGKYSYVNDQIIDNIDSLLRGFSEEIDFALYNINERFRVEIYDINSGNVFDYVAYHHRLVKISEICIESKTHEDFLNNLLDFMWLITADNARSAQTLVNDDLSSTIKNALDKLEVGIIGAKRDTAIYELMQEIKKARTLFTNEIELVLNWFKFVGASDDTNHEKLNIVIEATISSFESIYGHKYAPPTYSQNKSSVSLNYRESKSLFISLFTALENACKYGDKSKPVKLLHSLHGEYEKLEIVNSTINMDKEYADELISREKSKWNDDFLALNRAEGGSGLFKIYSILKSASDGFIFDINADNCNFICEIRLRNEYFSDRR